MKCSESGCENRAPGFDPRTGRAWCLLHCPEGRALSPYPENLRRAPIQIEIEERQPDEDLPLPAVPHDTSAGTAEAMREPMRGMRRKIYNSIDAQGRAGMTCEEVEKALDAKHQTASAAIATMQGQGLIVDSGIRRATSSGRPAAVWVSAKNCPDDRLTA